MTARELQEERGISQRTVYRLAKARLIPAYRVGVKRRGLRFDADEVLAALRQPATRKGSSR